MYRVSTSTAVATMPVTTAVSSPGFFQNQSANGSQPATSPGADWFNCVQEELMSIILAAGLTPSLTIYNQVLTAIKELIAQETGSYLTDTGTAGAYVVATNPVTASYAGQGGLLQIRFKAANGNLGACTLNAGAGALPLINDQETSMASGSIVASQLVTAVLDPTCTFFVATNISFAIHLADNSLKSSAAGLQVNESVTSIAVNTTLTAASHLANIVATAACVLTLPKAATVGMMAFEVLASGGAVTLAPNAADIMQGGQSSPTAGASYVLPQGGSAFVVVDGVSNWWLFNISVPSSIGKHTLSIPAGAIAPRVTNGAIPMAQETTTNKVFVRTVEFIPVTDTYAEFQVAMPKSWNGGTVTAKFIWSHYTTATNFKTSWCIAGVAYSRGNALDTAFGAAVQVNDVGGTVDTVYISPESAAITIGNSPAAGDLVVFEVYRNPADTVNDTLAVNAKLLGVQLFYTTNAATDA